MTWWLRGFLMNIIADTEFLDKSRNGRYLSLIEIRAQESVLPSDT